MPIRIFFGYRHTDEPWGGANNFIRTLNQTIRNNTEFELTSSFEEPCDILFMNQLSAGAKSDFKHWELATIQQRVKQFRHIEQKNLTKLVVRAVNLKLNVHVEGRIRTRLLGYLQDRKVLKLLNMADLAIFQSEYQYQVFKKAGYQGKSFRIIHNGADPEFWVENPLNNSSNNNRELRIVSSSVSTRAIKRYDIIAQFSVLPGVEVTHIGNWPKKVPQQNVKLAGLLPKTELKKIMVQSHYFLHPATRDACPNSILEALNAGLPVIYNPQPGSSHELVQDSGIALNEGDLEHTIAQAREQIDILRANVLKRRESFRIELVAGQYMSAFKSLFNTL